MYEWVAEVVDTDAWPAVESEEMGRKAKTWLRSPEDGSLWLFKHTRVDDEGRPHGEDWAEVLAGAVAQRMDLPHATVRHANRTSPGQPGRGVIVRHFSTAVDDRGSHQPLGSLEHGNELLSGVLRDYDTSATGAVDGYTVDNVLRVLRPHDCHPALVATPLDSAPSQFAAYLAFDALINATDRHHENWAVRSGVGPSYLVETYDHGACLGVPAPEHIREQRNRGEAGGVPQWLKRGATRFQGKPRPVEVAREALAVIPLKALNDIRERLGAVTDDWFGDVCDVVPDGHMSRHARIFAASIISLAREELLDE